MRSLILDSFHRAVPDVDPDASTLLLGRGAAIDSVSLVTLLVAVEQAVGGIDLSTAFLEHADDSDEANPFRSVTSLAEFLPTLVPARREQP
jgi:hypothetical protein